MKLVLRALGMAILVSACLTAAPAKVEAAVSVATDIAAGYDHNCAIVANGDAYCWGDNDYGQLGNNTLTQSNVPVLVSGGLSWASIDAGLEATCGITTSGAGYCWGHNTYGGLGDNTNNNQPVPTAINGGGTWLSIIMGRNFACGVKTGGVGYCWGAGSSGEIGNGVAGNVSIPTAVSGGHTWVSISAGAGAGHACGVTNTGDGYCWGWNLFGQVGDGTDNNNRLTPTAVSGGHGARSRQGRNIAVESKPTATASAGETTARANWATAQRAPAPFLLPPQEATIGSLLPRAKGSTVA